MTTFEDGPAKGQTLMLKRAPLFLRVVESPGKLGSWDALDQPDDKPEPNEKIYIYERVHEAGMVHINARNGGGFYTMATYRQSSCLPSDPEMRDNRGWQQWCRSQLNKTEDRAQ